MPNIVKIFSTITHPQFIFSKQVLPALSLYTLYFHYITHQGFVFSRSGSSRMKQTSTLTSENIDTPTQTLYYISYYRVQSRWGEFNLRCWVMHCRALRRLCLEFWLWVHSWGAGSEESSWCPGSADQRGVTGLLSASLSLWHPPSPSSESQLAKVWLEVRW